MKPGRAIIEHILYLANEVDTSHGKYYSHEFYIRNDQVRRYCLGELARMNGETDEYD